MTVATFAQSDYGTQLGTTYPTNIDKCIQVMARIAAAFAVHEQGTPDMTVKVDAGALFDGVSLTEVAAQNTASFTAPTTHDRLDYVCINSQTGVVTVVAGTEAVSPVAPAIPAGYTPVATVLLHTSTTAIGNSLITDKRVGFGSGSGKVALATDTGAADALVANFSPANSSLYDGLLIRVRAAHANATTTPHINVDGFGSIVMTRFGGVAMAVADIFGAGHELLLSYVSATPRWELLNPATPLNSTTQATADNSTHVATTAYVKAQGYITGNQNITLSGDVSGSGATSIGVSLASIVSASSFTFGTGSGTTPSGVAWDSKGRITNTVNCNCDCACDCPSC